MTELRKSSFSHPRTHDVAGWYWKSLHGNTRLLLLLSLTLRGEPGAPRTTTPRNSIHKGARGVMDATLPSSPLVKRGERAPAARRGQSRGVTRVGAREAARSESRSRPGERRRRGRARGEGSCPRSRDRGQSGATRSRGDRSRQPVRRDGAVRAPTRGAPGWRLPTLRGTGRVGEAPFAPGPSSSSRGGADAAPHPPRRRGTPPATPPVPSRPVRSRCTRGGRGGGGGCPGRGAAVPGGCREGPSGTYGVGGGAPPGVLARFPSGSGGLGARGQRLASPAHAPGPRGLVSRCRPRTRVGFARRGRSRGGERGRQPAPPASAPARRGGLAPGPPTPASGRRSPGAAAAQGRFSRGAAAAAPAAGRRGGEGAGGAMGPAPVGGEMPEKPAWGCACVCARSGEGVGRAWRGGDAAAGLGTGALNVHRCLKWEPRL